MDFGIMFFSSAGQSADGHKYRLLTEAAKFADRQGFSSVWTPERHFHEFGGLFPNPSVTNAALAMITERVQLRAGSLISPLHDPIRIVEEWAMVDNLSGGRVAISFGSGWNINDFVFFPDRYATRQSVMHEQIESVRRLWATGQITKTNSQGKEVELTLYPKPLQKELPVWVTSSGNAETFASAGAIGANILTHLIGQDTDTLAMKIERYRESRASHNFDPQGGQVSLMLHTFLGTDAEAVREKVRKPFREYLRSAISLEEKAALSGGAISGGHKIDPQNVPPNVMEELLDITFERYSRHASLIGTPSSCQQFIWKLQEIGVTEIACLIDFLEDDEAVLQSLPFLDELRAMCSAESLKRATTEALNDFLEDLES
jgi:natural product biosynthesis luciferase-like monooxygenase protein